MTPRWIGYSDVHGKYCSISRNTYLAMAREGTWGPTATIRGKIMVSEAAVKRWADEGGKTTRAIVRERIEAQGARPESENGSGTMGDNVLARPRGLATAKANYAAESRLVGGSNA